MTWISKCFPNTPCCLLTAPLLYSWKYTRTILGDGNFKQDHIAMKNDTDDVSFSDGLSYMVGKDRFNLYMDAVGALKSRNTKKRKENNVSIGTTLGTNLMSVPAIGRNLS